MLACPARECLVRFVIIGGGSFDPAHYLISVLFRGSLNSGEIKSHDVNLQLADIIKPILYF